MGMGQNLCPTDPQILVYVQQSSISHPIILVPNFDPYPDQVVQSRAPSTEAEGTQRPNGERLLPLLCFGPSAAIASRQSSSCSASWHTKNLGGTQGTPKNIVAPTSRQIYPKIPPKKSLIRRMFPHFIEAKITHQPTQSRCIQHVSQLGSLFLWLFSLFK